MKLLLNGIPEGISHQEGSLSIDPETCGISETGEAISYRARFDRRGMHIGVRFTYTGTVRIPCCRCCKQFNQKLAGHFQFCVREKLESVSDEDDMDVVTIATNDNKQEIDCRKVIADEICLSLPMMPLCSSDCRGILTRPESVGKVNDVSDTTTPTDPRWGPLMKLKQRPK